MRAIPASLGPPMSPIRKLMVPAAGLVLAASVGSLVWEFLGVIEDGPFRLSVLITFVAAITILPMIWEVHLGRLDLGDGKNLFLLYILLQFAVWPSWVLIAGYETWAGMSVSFQSTRLFEGIEALRCAAAALFCFHLGFYGIRLFLSRRRSWVISFEIRPKVFPLVVGTLAVGGWFSFFTLLAQQTDILGFFTRIDEFRSQDLLGIGYLFYGMNLLYLAFLLVYSVRALQGGYGKLTAFLFASCMIVSLFGAFRHMALQAIMGWFVIRHYAVRRFALRPKIFLLAGAFLVLNVLYVSFRGRGGDPLDIFRSSHDLGEAFFEGLFARFHGVESLARIIDVTGNEGHLGGVFLAQDFTNAWLPRALWPEKPLASGMVANVLFFGDFYKGDETGCAIISLLGYLYWIAGLAGMVIGMVLIGAFLGWAVHRLPARRDPFGMGLYALVFMFAAFVNEDLSLHLTRSTIMVVLWIAIARIGLRWTARAPGKKAGRGLPDPGPCQRSPSRGGSA